MPNRLTSKLAELRRRVRSALWLNGLSWVTIFLCTVLLGYCVTDWLFQLDDPGVRLIFGISMLAGLGGVLWKFLIAPLSEPLNDLQLALKVESRFPGFKEGYSSSISFLQHDLSAETGAPELQQRVVTNTLQQLERINISDVVQTRTVRRVALVAATAMLFVVVLASFHHLAATTALQRLALPFSDLKWPRRTELQFVDEQLVPLPQVSQSIAQGATLELYVQNSRGQLPDDLKLEYQFGTAELRSESMHVTLLRDSEGQAHNLGVVTLTVTQGPLRLRAVGGDDTDMQMQVVEVVPPPMLEHIQIQLTPPEYTHEPPLTLPGNVGHIKAMVGTLVELTAISNKPLQSAQLRVKGQLPQKLYLEDEHRKVQATFTIEKPGSYSYWLELKDVAGFKNSATSKYEIHGIADAIPDVYIEHPATNTSFTPTAIIPLKVVAKDDLGLQEISLHTRHSDAIDDQANIRVLWAGDNLPTEQSAEEAWPLAPLNLVPGMQLEFHAETTDAFFLGSSRHTGRSVTRMITIVSGKEKQAELAMRQTSLNEELRDIYKSETSAHDQLHQLTLQLEKTGKLQPADFDTLKRTELDQRQIGFRLINPVDSVEAKALALAGEFQQNNIAAPRLQNQLRQLIDELSLLREQALPAIEESIIAARKELQTNHQGLKPKSKGKSSRELQALNEAKQNQQEVLTTLQTLLDQLSEWQNKSSLSTDLTELISGQQLLNSDADKLGKQTIGKQWRALSAQQQADLSRLAHRQNRMREKLESLSNHLQKLSSSTKKTSAAESMKDTLEQLNDRGITTHMREVADKIDANQIGQALDDQQQILDDLQSLRNVFQNKEIDEQELLLKKVKEASDELEKIEQQQTELLKKQRQLEQVPNREEREQQLQQLRKEQRTLQHQANRLKRTLKRLRSRSASEALSRAAERMQQLAEAESSVDTERLQQETLDDLMQSRRELARDKQRIEEQLTRELMEKVSGKLKSLALRQHALISETKRIGDQHRIKKRWSRGLLKSLKLAANTQHDLQQAAEQLAGELSKTEIIALAVRGAANNMEQAAEQLQARKTGNTTLQFQQAAHRRLRDLITAIQADNEVKPEGNPRTGGGGASNNQDDLNSEIISQLTQLRVLKTLQTEILTRTVALDKQRRPETPLSAAEQQELKHLTEEQARLTELTRIIMRTLQRK